jgi:pimeloyl-ACP methyl ester carboxylesterase
LREPYRIPGLVLTDHVVEVPLDHHHPDERRIEVFAREVVGPDNVGKELPWLLFLQGGPGAKSPRPTSADSWLGRAVQSHRVLLLDQRGTGRSTPISARTVQGQDANELAAYLRFFRADSIVADAELIRSQLVGDQPWDTLGQSYGGFVTLTYLSQAPQGLRTCYVTGGIPGLTVTADEVYARTYPRVAAKNAEYYRRYPDDVKAVRRIADHLEANDVRLPDGDRLTARRLRALGNAFGMSDGYERVHWPIEEAVQDLERGDELSDGFRHHVMATTGFVDTPLFALQEYTYGQGTGATAWAAQRAFDAHPDFAPDATPLLFTGEMMYPWMFEEIAALRPFAGAAEVLAAADDWPLLYDLDRLAANEVPLITAVYFDDMYVDSGLQLDTLRVVGNSRAWVTNEFEHDGLRKGHVLGRLLDMGAGRI